MVSGFIFGEGSDKACIDAKTCTDKGNHEAKEGVCAEKVPPPCDQGLFLYTADDGSTQCLSAATCVMNARGVYSVKEGTCISRDAWLSASELNYVNIDFSARTYSGASLPTKAADLCKLEGESVEGASLLKGRICTCSEEDAAKMYLMIGTYQCTAAPTDKSLLTHVFQF